MNEQVLRRLEFDKVRDMLTARCVSTLGAVRAAALVPGSSPLAIADGLRETTQAAAYIKAHGGSPMRGFDDVGDAVNRACIGATLTIPSLGQVAGTLGVSRQLRRLLETHCEEGSVLTQIAYGLCALHATEDEIKRCLLNDEELHDQASAELSHIRREIRQGQARIREKMEAMVRSQSFQKYLQEPIITLRGGRYVVPVKQEYRTQVPGLIHDQSGSGSTLFIEPMAVVEINNRLREWEAREREEIERILKALTGLVAQDGDLILRALDTLATLDFVFAKGMLSLDMDGTEPVMNDQGALDIRKGRHPLIDRKVIVPVSLWLGRDFTTLVVTGPNTGGKTVTLKTCGLLALMAQAGLHVPAEEGSIFPVFDEVFADIGDEQSIEQSLSTFSSHMGNIVSILAGLSNRSLVLLDELGAGTDPIEGAALAMAILERLTAAGVRTAATTHYSELKAYALSTPGVENASMDFDVDTLRPTYRLTIGIPGKSNAFEISRRLGLPSPVIERARELLSQEAVRFEDVIQNAQYHRAMAEKEKEVAERARVEMEQIKKELEQQRRKLDEQRDVQLRKAREDARSLVNRAKGEVESIISALRGAGKAQLDPDQARAVQQARDALRALQAETSAGEPTQDARKPEGEAPASVRAGDAVVLLDIEKEATVLSPANEKGDVQVQVGMVRMTTRLKNLRLSEKAEQERRRASSAHASLVRSSVSMELDIRGFDGLSGVEALDKYLDDAALAGLKEVNIIHGKGTGALRDAVWQYLRRSPRVDSFRIGRYGEGDAGVTVVALK